MPFASIRLPSAVSRRCLRAARLSPCLVISLAGDFDSMTVLMALSLLVTHLLANSGFLNREHSAKTTALVGTLWLNNLESLNEREEVFNLIELRLVMLRWRRKAEFAHSVTRVMKTHLCLELPKGLVHLQHIMQKLYDIHNHICS